MLERVLNFVWVVLGRFRCFGSFLGSLLKVVGGSGIVLGCCFGDFVNVLRLLSENTKSSLL